MTIVPANESEHKSFLPTIKQGIRNCGKDKVKVIVADRGFLDGKHLWTLKYQMKIDFIIPAKKGMIVREDAIALRNKMPKHRFSEWVYGKDKCKGYGINGLLTYIGYNQSNTVIQHNKSTNGTPINAVVVTQWRGKNVAEEKQTVFLTSLPAEDAAAIAQNYRLRSLIENCGFRELKQASFLNHIPRRVVKNRKKTSSTDEELENIAYIHIMMCVFAHTLFFAFLGWRKKQVTVKSEKEQENQATPIRCWRRKAFMTDSKILIIAEAKYYAFFEAYELLDIFDVQQDYRVKRN